MLSIPNDDEGAMTENWMQTDEVEDVFGSIRHAIRTADFVTEDPQAWKWVILALHSALQGACVCHLTTGAQPLGAVTPRNANEWLTHFEESCGNPKAMPPETRLMALPDLLKAVRKPSSSGGGGDTPGVTVSDSELSWLRRFHYEFRNQFTHFAPTGWSIEVSGIPAIANLVARIIGDILQIGWAFRHLEPAQLRSMQLDIERLARIKWPA